MNHYKRNNGALVDALGVVIAVAITAAISLIAASQYSALRASSVTPPRSEVCVNCGSTPSEPSASLVGTWGGDHISMAVAETGAHIELDCAHGDIPTRLPAASFSVAGTFVREHGGPIRPGEVPDSHPALYSAATSGDIMTLTIRLTDIGELLGPFALTRGAPGRVFR